MREVFDTKRSLNKFKYILPMYLAIGFPLPGVYLWLRQGDVTLTRFVTSALAGFCLGLFSFFIMWMRYRNVFFEITDDYISKKKGVKTMRSVSVRDIEYYSHSDREKYPRLKVHNERDFEFEMTLGQTSGIVSALEKLGINKQG